MAKVEVGDIAPDFELKDKDDNLVKLSNYRGKQSVVLYFYPKDETSGCTAQACSFRDSYEDFKAAGAEVIGISSDTKRSHEGFASRHSLPFVLLSDIIGKVVKPMVLTICSDLFLVGSRLSLTKRVGSSTNSIHS
jgi:peroxiredoxin Q/BCP